VRTVRTLARPELFQWFGLFAAALAWTVQHVVGFGATLARCGAGSVGANVKAWEIGVLAVGALFAVAAEAAAVTVLIETRGVEHDDPPPDGRRQFFASAAVLGNVLFLVIIVLSSVGVLTQTPCRQA
jgi:hypothetical protein